MCVQFKASYFKTGFLVLTGDEQDCLPFPSDFCLAWWERDEGGTEMKHVSSLLFAMGGGPTICSRLLLPLPRITQCSLNIPKTLSQQCWPKLATINTATTSTVYALGAIWQATCVSLNSRTARQSAQTPLLYEWSGGGHPVKTGDDESMGRVCVC